MNSNSFFAQIILFLLIFIVCSILAGGLYFICRAICFKARNVPRRHLKHWVPNIFNSIRPSPECEMILNLPEGIDQNVNLIKKDSFTQNIDDQQQSASENFESNIKFSNESVSATIEKNGNWDEAQIGLLSTFSTQAEPSILTNSSDPIIFQDYSKPPIIIPSVHNLV